MSKNLVALTNDDCSRLATALALTTVGLRHGMPLPPIINVDRGELVSSLKELAVARLCVDADIYERMVEFYEAFDPSGEEDALGIPSVLEQEVLDRWNRLREMKANALAEQEAQVDTPAVSTENDPDADDKPKTAAAIRFDK